MSVVLTLSYHDSEPGGGICADAADAKREAAKVAREVLENYNPDEDDFSGKIQSFLSERPEVAEGDPRFDREDLTAADLDDDEALDLAADDMEFTWATLPGAPDYPPPAVEIALLRRLAGTVGPVLAEHGREDDCTEAMGAAFDAYQDAPAAIQGAPDAPAPWANLVAAAQAVVRARDYYAEHGRYDSRDFGPSADQGFDDWSADILETALGAGPAEPAPDPAPASGPSADAALELGVVLARRVVENWAQGDLAGAVNALEEWAEEVEGDFPALDLSDDDEGDEEPARDGMGARLDGLPG